MSGEGTTPPIVPDEHTRALIENLVQSGVQSTLAARAADRPWADANANAQGEHPVAGGNEVAGTSETTGRGDGGHDRGEPADESQAVASSEARDAPLDYGGANREGVESGDSGDSDRDGEAENTDQAFTVPWYEARRGESIALRFDIPGRFDPRYPVGF
jgi:hypothetical protein